MEDVLKVYADQNSIRKVLYKLIINAIKFSEHGKIKVVLTRVKKQIEISVIDSGIGIAPEMQKTYFLPLPNWMEATPEIKEALD